MVILNWITTNTVRIFAIYLVVRGLMFAAEWLAPAFETPRWALTALLIFTLAAVIWCWLRAPAPRDLI